MRELIGEARACSRWWRELQLRVGVGIATGTMSSQASAVARVFHCLASMRQTTIAFDVAGAAGSAWDGRRPLARAGTDFLMRQVACIGGGTTEMARNVVSERVLGMPREHTLDKDVAFRDVPQQPDRRNAERVERRPTGPARTSFEIRKGQAEMKIGGSKAIVVGGASGMARATAELLVKAGGKVAILDRPNSKGADVASALGGGTKFYLRRDGLRRHREGDQVRGERPRRRPLRRQHRRRRHREAHHGEGRSAPARPVPRRGRSQPDRELQHRACRRRP